MKNSMKGNENKVVVLTSVPYAPPVNPYRNEPECTYFSETSTGILYVAKESFSREADFTAYITPRPILLGPGGNPLICHSLKDIKVENLMSNDYEGLRYPNPKSAILYEFSLYNLIEDPFLNRPLKTEQAGFFPDIETEIKFSDRVVKLKEGRFSNDLLLVDSASDEILDCLFNPYLYFKRVFRSDEYLFIITNDYYYWDSAVNRINLSANASFSDLPIIEIKGRRELDVSAGVGFSHPYIFTGAVVDKVTIEKIVANYEVEPHFEEMKARHRKKKNSK